VAEHGLTVIILTLDEEIHIQRCIESIVRVATRVIVVDSGSTDRTRAIAAEHGADVYQNPFMNYASQFNWALDNTGITTEWVMRLDADEYITPELARMLPATLTTAALEVSGYTLRLRRVFMGKWLRHGALYPIRLLRVWKYGRGRCEERWMDEHMVVNGELRHLNGDFADHNLKSLTWWTDKHNRYASREAVDLLTLEYGLRTRQAYGGTARDHGPAAVKRWIKENVYSSLPGGLRALAYFLYRYVLRLGFLDGEAGAIFHVLQGFWYRYLVDAKVAEVRQRMRETGEDVATAAEHLFGIRP
jgi:glycosyltransferase involved in cell wall biosynthesis